MSLAACLPSKPQIALAITVYEGLWEYLFALKIGTLIRSG